MSEEQQGVNVPLLSPPEQQNLLSAPPSDDAKYGSFETNTPKTSPLTGINIDPNHLRLSQSNTDLVLRPIVKKPTLERVFSRIEPGSLRGTTFTLTSSAIGAGMLSLGLVMKTVGLGLGVGLTIVGALLAYASLIMLLDTADTILLARGMTGGRRISYSEIVEQILGERWSIVVEAVFCVYSFGVIVGYFLVIGTSIDDLFEAVFNIQISDNSLAILLAATLATPLCMMKDISSLTMASMLQIATMAYISLVVAYRGWNAGSLSDTPSLIIRTDNGGSGFCSSITIVFFAYNCHTNMFAVYSSMRYPLLRRIKKAAGRSIGIQFALYSLVGGFGYILFKNETSGNILDNFPVDDKLASLAKGGLAIALLIGLPINMHPTRANLFSLARKWRGCGCASCDYSNCLGGCSWHGLAEEGKEEEEEEDKKKEGIKNQAPQKEGKQEIMNNTPRSAIPGVGSKDDDTIAAGQPSLTSHIAVTLLILGCALFLALNVPEVSIVFSFLGATACILTCYVFPIVMYVSILGHVHRDASVSFRLAIKIGLYTLLCALCVIGVVSIYELAGKVAKNHSQ